MDLFGRFKTKTKDPLFADNLAKFKYFNNKINNEQFTKATTQSTSKGTTPKQTMYFQQ